MTTRVSSSVLANTAVTPGVYGGSDVFPVITVDQQGRLTTAANTSLKSTGVTASTYGGSDVFPVITVDAQGRLSSAANTSLKSTGVVAGTYGGAGSTPTVNYILPVITVDAQGRLSSAANVTITNTSIVANTGQLTANSSTGVVALGLASTAVTPGTYGGAATSHYITVDQQGRITATANMAIAITSGAVSGLATSATTDTTNATNISSGTLPSARISGSYTGITGVGTLASGSVPTSLITGLAASATTDTTNAANISIGTLPSARISGSYTGITGVGTLASGSVPTSLITGLATSATTDTTNATNISSGTLAAARLPYTMDQGVATTNNVQHNSLGIGTAGSGTAGEIRATNNITAYYSSDIKFKENVQDIPNALEKVNVIGGKLFDWTDEYIEQHGGEDGYFVQKADFGVIAQDVQSVFPIATRTRPDGSLAVDYEKLCALAFAAIKELKLEVEQLKNKN